MNQYVGAGVKHVFRNGLAQRVTWWSPLCSTTHVEANFEGYFYLDHIDGAHITHGRHKQFVPSFGWETWRENTKYMEDESWKDGR